LLLTPETGKGSLNTAICFILFCTFNLQPEGFAIPIDVSRIHGITTERAKQDGKPLTDVLQEFHSLIMEADVLVAHNMNFDEKIVGAEFLRVGMKNPIPSKRKICTMESTTTFCALNGAYDFKWPKLSEYKQFKSVCQGSVFIEL